MLDRLSDERIASQGFDELGFGVQENEQGDLARFAAKQPADVLNHDRGPFSRLVLLERVTIDRSWSERGEPPVCAAIDDERSKSKEVRTCAEWSASVVNQRLRW